MSMFKDLLERCNSSEVACNLGELGDLLLEAIKYLDEGQISIEEFDTIYSEISHLKCVY